MKNKCWSGHINLRYLDTGKRERIKNAILDAGLELTANLWLGNSTETFAQLQIEGAGVGDELAKTISASYTVAAGVATVTSTAIFTSGEITFDVTTIALIGSEGTRIAEATVNITSGSAVEVTREDELTEAV